MIDPSSSVPKVRLKRQKTEPVSPGRHPPENLSGAQQAAMIRWKFPAPDDEPFDSVDQLDFSIRYFVFMFALISFVAIVAGLVIVPAVSLFVAG